MYELTSQFQYVSFLQVKNWEPIDFIANCPLKFASMDEKWCE